MITSRLPVSEIRERGGFTRSTRFRPVCVEVPDLPQVDPLAESYRSGFEDGQLAARAEARDEMERERKARGAIEMAFIRLDEQAAKDLRERLQSTVHALCEEAVLPLALDPKGLAHRIGAAVALLQRRDDERVIRIHPDDLALVRENVDPSVSLVPDPSIERGGLRVETADGGIEDGPEQWRRALAEAFGTC